MSNGELLIRYYQEADILQKSNSVTKYLKALNLIIKIVSSSKFLDNFI